MKIPYSLNILSDKNVWLNYIKKPRPNGGYGKPPVDPNTLMQGNATDPKSWSDFNTANSNIGKEVNVYGGTYQISGVGIVLGAANIVGIDLDHVLKKTDDGRILIQPQAREIIKKLNTYTEISPSGTGFHLLAFSSKYKLPEGCKHKIKNPDGTEYEIYDSGRHFTVTGNVFQNCPDINDRSEEIEHLVNSLFSSLSADSVGSPRHSGVNRDVLDIRPDIPEDIPLTPTNEDKALWNRMMSNKYKGNDIRKLFNGGLYTTESGCPDRSSNDLAILNHLAYWTKCNAAVMERMYLETHLDHSKWHSSDAYRTATINKAIEGTKKLLNKEKQS